MGTISPRGASGNASALSSKYRRRGNISISQQQAHSMILTTQEAQNLEHELNVQMGDFMRPPKQSQADLELRKRHSNMLEVKILKSDSKTSQDGSVADEKSLHVTSSHLVLDRTGNFYTIQEIMGAAERSNENSARDAAESSAVPAKQKGKAASSKVDAHDSDKTKDPPSPTKAAEADADQKLAEAGRKNSNQKEPAPAPTQYKALVSKVKHKIEKFLDSTSVTVFMTLITIYALYFDDLRILFFPKSADDIFFGITLLGMICFGLEIILASFAKDDYMFSFFFYLDLVSTLSMIPDCGWIWNAIIDSEGDTGADGADSATNLAKTSRASKVTRVIRIIRLIRLIRIVKLYKQKQAASKLQLKKSVQDLKKGAIQRKHNM